MPSKPSFFDLQALTTFRAPEQVQALLEQMTPEVMLEPHFCSKLRCWWSDILEFENVRPWKENGQLLPEPAVTPDDYRASLGFVRFLSGLAAKLHKLDPFPTHLLHDITDQFYVPTSRNSSTAIPLPLLTQFSPLLSSFSSLDSGGWSPGRFLLHQMAQHGSLSLDQKIPIDTISSLFPIVVYRANFRESFADLARDWDAILQPGPEAWKIIIASKQRLTPFLMLPQLLQGRPPHVLDMAYFGAFLEHICQCPLHELELPWESDFNPDVSSIEVGPVLKAYLLDLQAKHREQQLALSWGEAENPPQDRRFRF